MSVFIVDGWSVWWCCGVACFGLFFSRIVTYIWVSHSILVAKPCGGG